MKTTVGTRNINAKKKLDNTRNLYSVEQKQKHSSEAKTMENNYSLAKILADTSF